MDFKNLERTWDSFGKKDPMWAILSWEEKKGNKWDPREFFRIGESEINHILSEVEKRKVVKYRYNSLDFGCGIGRLTFPLAKVFKESHGVDVSEAMILQANRYCSEKGITNCTFHLNQSNHLGIFEDNSFDFILSIIVLQHMEPRFFLEYIKEFIRLLKEDGVLLFQLPDTVENRADYEVYTDNIEPVMEMYGMGKSDITSFLEANGGIVVDAIEDKSCGPDLKSHRYFVTK